MERGKGKREKGSVWEGRGIKEGEEGSVWGKGRCKREGEEGSA